jgi:ubiquinone biosynthesis accessory factor UbiJ
LSALESLVSGVASRMLQLDSETLRRLGEMEGKIIRLDLGEAERALTIYVLPSAQGLRFAREHDGAPHVTLRGTIPVFARLARTGIAAGELQISGDIDLGSRFKRILESVDLDWEEPLSRVLGDVVAHRIGETARSVFGWSRRAVDHLARDTVEYFQEESRLLAPRVRVEEFLEAVDTLRLDADRLQQRLERLERARR